MELSREELRIIRRALDLEYDRKMEIHTRCFFSSDCSDEVKNETEMKAQAVLQILVKVEQELKKEVQA